jgi:hypothetical protein
MNYKDFYDHLFEFSATSGIKSSEWYHGTNEESAVNIIKSGGLNPSTITTKKSRGLQPVSGKTYLTRDIEEALAYAYLRSGAGSFKYPRVGDDQKFGYVIVIDGNELKEIQPDEDIIADLVMDYESNMVNGKHIFPWLVQLAKSKTPSLYKKYEREGDYSYGTEMGKVLMKYLSDGQKEQLINHGKKLAHDGPLKVKEVWRIYLSRHSMYKSNPENFKSYSKRIK